MTPDNRRLNISLPFAWIFIHIILVTARLLQTQIEKAILMQDGVEAFARRTASGNWPACISTMCWWPFFEPHFNLAHFYSFIQYFSSSRLIFTWTWFSVKPECSDQSWVFWNERGLETTWFVFSPLLMGIWCQLYSCPTIHSFCMGNAGKLWTVHNYLVILLQQSQPQYLLVFGLLDTYCVVCIHRSTCVLKAKRKVKLAANQV